MSIEFGWLVPQHFGKSDEKLLAEGQRLEQMPAQIEYFATSLPTMLLFEHDLQRQQTVDAVLLKAHAQAGLGRRDLANQLLARMAELDPSRSVETTSWRAEPGR